MAFELRFYEDGIDMREILDGNLHGIEAPASELREQARAAVGKRTGKEKGVYAKAHGEIRRSWSRKGHLPALV